MVIFKRLNILPTLQNRVLTIGIISAIILRLIMIVCGIKMIQHLSFVLPLLGIFLIYIGVGTFKKKSSSIPGFNFFQKYIPYTKTDKENFFIKKDGRYHATQLFLALIYVEIADIIFAIDSIPAAISITQNIYVIALANILSIIGLRFMYKKLEILTQKLQYLNYSLGCILCFIGCKMCFQIHISTMIILCIFAFFFLLPFVLQKFKLLK